MQQSCDTRAVFPDIANPILFPFSKKKKPDSKKVLLFISLHYDTTNVIKILVWWRSFYIILKKNKYLSET